MRFTIPYIPINKVIQAGWNTISTMRYSSWFVYYGNKTVWSYYIEFFVYRMILLKNVAIVVTAEKRFWITAAWLQKMSKSFKNLLLGMLGSLYITATKHRKLGALISISEILLEWFFNHSFSRTMTREPSKFLFTKA